MDYFITFYRCFGLLLLYVQAWEWISVKNRKIAKFPQNRLKMNEIAKFGRQKNRNSCLNRNILMPVCGTYILICAHLVLNKAQKITNYNRLIWVSCWGNYNFLNNTNILMFMLWKPWLCHSIMDLDNPIWQVFHLLSPITIQVKIKSHLLWKSILGVSPPNYVCLTWYH